MTSDEIKKAMQDFSPIEYDGIVYDRISAYIYRVMLNKHTGKYKGILQVELLDKCKNSVVIAESNKIKIHD